MIKTKICGLCRAEDAATAVAAGADYVGIILAAGYSRSQSLVAAREIFAAADGAQRVGVFVNSEISVIQDAVRALRLDVVQLHGEESRALASELTSIARVWKAVRVQRNEDFAFAPAEFAAVASGLLLDAYDPTRAGGTGKTLRWSELRGVRTLLSPNFDLIVAGGLTPENVAEAIDLLRPDVVDVSSGVESETGRKSAQRVRAFIENAHAAAQTIAAKP